MTETVCTICGLELTSLDEYFGHIKDTPSGRFHSHCLVLKAGAVPECPLYESITPKPCSNDCLQARACENPEGCSCCCENLECPIGKSVRALRDKGMIPWEGYIPHKVIQDALKEEWEKKRDIVHPESVDWDGVRTFVLGLSSHGVYKPNYLVDKLNSLGLPSELLRLNCGITVCGRLIGAVQPDFGHPGIGALALAYELLEVMTGERYCSPYSGRGYQYRDVMEQFDRRLKTP